MNRSTYSRFVTVGRSVSDDEDQPNYVPSDDLQPEINSALGANYDSVSLFLTNERWKTRWQKMCLSGPQTPPNRQDSLQGQRSPARIKLENTASGLFRAPSDQKDAEIDMEAELWRAGGGFQREEVNIMRNDQADHVIGFVSEWLELDSQIEGVRYDSEIALRQELQYASYLGISNVILPSPRRGQEVTTYARAINDCIASSAVSPYMILSIRIPVCDIPPEDGAAAKGVNDYEDELSATWQMWNTIRMICGPTPRVSVALDLTPALPALPGVLSRWSAEHVQHLILPATTFIPNAKGYPVLPKLMQGFLRDLFKNRPNIILSKTQTNLHKLGGEPAYAQYVRHLEKTSPFNVARDAPDGLTVESFGRGYEDFLQAPLQPLMDNLASMTYEVFERDPVKYRQYEQAVYRALLDQPPDSTTIICVAGAGRGPIVSNCIRAVERSGRNARIYAIEKNPSAFVTLQGRKAREWPDFVHIKFGDMRAVQLPEPVDILVSELLGSFGDNELSPECLDGAMRLLKRKSALCMRYDIKIDMGDQAEGISIPASYTAYLAPISASRLYNYPSGILRDTKGAETPYVVMLHAINTLSGDSEDRHPRCGPKIQDCWTFEHPRKIVLDPQAGYFEAVLYKDVGITTHPERMEKVSPNMLSWFPIFFPFKETLYLPSNSELDVYVWRLSDAQKVWYEWMAESFLPCIVASKPAVVPSPARSNTLGVSLGNQLLPSPMLDAPSGWGGQTRSDSFFSAEGERELRVKIGQTALHNPAGRSSWIGLEAHEEIGLPAPSPVVHILGLLSPFVSLYRLAVTPVVAFLSDLTLLDHLKPNPEEVDEIFDHPLEALLSPELAASLAPRPEQPLSKRGSEQWPYESEYHEMKDSPWLHGSWYRMHKFRTVTTPISGLTSDILILAAQIAYVRNTDYERYAKGYITSDIALGWAMEQHVANARAVSQPQPPPSAESHIEGLAD
ncbi:methyltransferase protein [Ceratobasidium sp. 423]|nr:methyltransferase protein [Ceratobasidium sp. 423]